MNLKDFKEWLNQFPDDTVVQTVDIEWTDYGYEVDTVEFDPEYNSQFTDSHFIGKTLKIGIH